MSRCQGHRAFSRLWAAAGIANLGDGMGKIAAPLMATQLTDSPVLIGGLASMIFVPYLFLGVPAGTLADRFERRTVMLVANAVRVLVLALTCVALLNGVLTIGWLFGLVFVLGAVECLYDAAADAAVPYLVPTQRLDWANSRLQGTISATNEFIGGPIGARLFASSAVLAFLAQCLGFLLALILVFTLPRLSPNPEPCATRASQPPSLRHELRRLWEESAEGVRWLASHRALRGVAIVTAISGMAIELAQGTLVLYSLHVLHLSMSSFGLFASSMAAGVLIGTILAPKLASRLGRTRSMVLGLSTQPVTLVGVGLAPNVAASVLALACFATSVGIWNVMSVSLRQVLTPSAMYGRVHGAWRAMVWGALPIGGWAGGVIAQHLGLRAPWFFAAGLLSVAAAAAVFVLHSSTAEINTADITVAPTGDPVVGSSAQAGALPHQASVQTGVAQVPAPHVKA